MEDSVGHVPVVESTAGSEYAVVHLVAQESFKGLIESQVIDHMAVQATVPGVGRPSRIVVGLIEPARVAIRRATRDRSRELQARGGSLYVRLLPYIGRLSVAANARWMSRRLRREVGRLPVVFHCRGESAVAWASAIRESMPRAAIVADFRGIWPDEQLHARGYGSPADADEESLGAYRAGMANIRHALAVADESLAVSEPLREWLVQHGGDADRLSVVPCSVRVLAADPARRTAARARLGLEDKLVLAYLGTVVRYQHIADGFAAFCREAMRARRGADIHVLCITPHLDPMRRQLVEAGIPDRAVTIVSVPQRAVPDILCAADAGFLIREGSVVNRVAMPVKLGEYLACGVPVIVSRVDGWVGELVERAGAGVAVDWFGASASSRAAEVSRSLRAIAEGGMELRHRASRLCREMFLWDTHVPRVRATYRRALEHARALGDPRDRARHVEQDA